MFYVTKHAMRNIAFDLNRIAFIDVPMPIKKTASSAVVQMVVHMENGAAVELNYTNSDRESIKLSAQRADKEFSLMIKILTNLRRLQLLEKNSN